MAVDYLSCAVSRLQLSDYVGVGVDYAGIVHEFAQTEHAVVTDMLLYVLARKDCSARLERGCRHAGGKLNLYVEGNVFRRLYDIVHAVHAAYVGYLVRVGYNRRGAPRNYERGELLGRKLGTFDVHVTVDVSGEDGKPLHVVFFYAFVLSDADNPVADYGYVALVRPARIHVYVASVFEDYVRLGATCSRIDVLF